MSLSQFSIPIALLLCGCAQTPAEREDRRLYRAMQLERQALVWEYGNATNSHLLQQIIDRNGIRRSVIEGYIP